MEKNKEQALQEFNLEKALAGDPVVTRDGREVTQLHLFRAKDEEYPLIGVVDKQVEAFTDEGRYLNRGRNRKDLFMAPKKLQGYVVLYKDHDLLISRTFAYSDSTELVAEFIRSIPYKVVAIIDLSEFTEGYGL